MIDEVPQDKRDIADKLRAGEQAFEPGGVSQMRAITY